MLFEILIPNKIRSSNLLVNVESRLTKLKKWACDGHARGE
jgi:hypothetical protein